MKVNSASRLRSGAKLPMAASTNMTSFKYKTTTFGIRSPWAIIAFVTRRISATNSSACAVEGSTLGAPIGTSAKNWSRSVPGGSAPRPWYPSRTPR